MIDVLIDMTSLNTPSRLRGIGRYTASLCHEFADMDTGLSLAALTRHRGPMALALDPTLRFEGDGSKPGDLQYTRYKMERRLFLGGLARRSGARLLHLPDPYGTPLDMRTPRIATCLDLIPLLLHRRYLRYPGGRLLQLGRDIARYRTPRRIIAISHSTKHDLVEHVGVADTDIDVVHLGVDHERYVPDPADGERERVAEFVGFSTPFLLYLGAASVQKNIPLLLRAYARSQAKGELPLVLAGPTTPRQKKSLEETIEREGLRGHAHLRGYVPESLVPALYRRCHAHIFPSSYEGFGLPVLEAMACGAPNVTTTCSSLGEVVGDAALTIAQPELDPLADAITRIAADSDLRASLRLRGIARAQQFTWRRCAEETLMCYVRALA